MYTSSVHRDSAGTERRSGCGRRPTRARSVFRRNECGGSTRKGRKGRGRAGVAGLPRAPAHGQGGVRNTCLPPRPALSRPCALRVLLAPRTYSMPRPDVSRPALPSLSSTPGLRECTIDISRTSARPLLSSRIPPSIARCACELRNATGPRPDIHTPPAPASPSHLSPHPPTYLENTLPTTLVAKPPPQAHARHGLAIRRQEARRLRHTTNRRRDSRRDGSGAHFSCTGNAARGD